MERADIVEDQYGRSRCGLARGGQQRLQRRVKNAGERRPAAGRALRVLHAAPPQRLWHGALPDTRGRAGGVRQAQQHADGRADSQRAHRPLCVTAPTPPGPWRRRRCVRGPPRQQLRHRRAPDSGGASGHGDAQRSTAASRGRSWGASPSHRPAARLGSAFRAAAAAGRPATSKGRGRGARVRAALLCGCGVGKGWQPCAVLRWLLCRGVGGGDVSWVHRPWLIHPWTRRWRNARGWVGGAGGGVHPPGAAGPSHLAAHAAARRGALSCWPTP